MIRVEIETIRREKGRTFIDSKTKTFGIFAEALTFLRTDLGLKASGFDQIIISNIEGEK